MISSRFLYRSTACGDDFEPRIRSQYRVFFLQCWRMIIIDQQDIAARSILRACGDILTFPRAWNSKKSIEPFFIRHFESDEPDQERAEILVTFALNWLIIRFRESNRHFAHHLTNPEF